MGVLLHVKQKKIPFIKICPPEFGTIFRRKQQWTTSQHSCVKGHSFKHFIDIFCHFYFSNRTCFKSESVISVQGVPLTSYMETLIVNSANSKAEKVCTTGAPSWGIFTADAALSIQRLFWKCLGSSTKVAVAEVAQESFGIFLAVYKTPANKFVWVRWQSSVKKQQRPLSAGKVTQLSVPPCLFSVVSIRSC